MNEALAVKVAFGKYSGKRLSEVPYAYVKWISTNVEPAMSGADVVYKMIFAARTIVEGMHLPDQMPARKKYNATPTDIMRDDPVQLVDVRKRLQKGHWEIKNGQEDIL